MHCFYDADFLWHRKKFLLCVACFAAEATLNLLLPQFHDAITTLSSIGYSVIALYDYKGEKLRGLLRFWLYTLLLLMPSFTFSFLASAFFSQDAFRALISVYSATPDFAVTDLAVFMEETALLVACAVGIVHGIIIFLFAYPVYKKGIVIQCGKRENWLMIVAGVLSNLFINLFAFAIANQLLELLALAMAALGILLSFLFPVFIYHARVSDYFRKQTALQEQHIQAELAHFRQYQKSQEETARFRHDIKNNLLCINELLQQGKQSEATEYLTDLLDIVGSLSNKYVTGDTLLDSIVGVKVQRMEQLEIRFSLDGVLAGGLSWKPVDICNVFANALDNAIEACTKLPPEQRSITMQIKATPKFWFVTLENPVAAPVDTRKLFQKSGGYTTKSDASRHGIGTYNMKRTVEAYGAMLNADCTDNYFKLEIMIDKNSPE